MQPIYAGVDDGHGRPVALDVHLEVRIVAQDDGLAVVVRPEPIELLLLLQRGDVVAELQGARSDQQSLMLSPEQQAELQRFQDEKLRIRKELRQVRRQLDADIEALGAKLKFLNIVAMPLLVTLVAIALMLWRARRRNAAARAALETVR